MDENALNEVLDALVADPRLLREARAVGLSITGSEKFLEAVKNSGHPMRNTVLSNVRPAATDA